MPCVGFRAVWSREALLPQVPLPLPLPRSLALHANPRRSR